MKTQTKQEKNLILERHNGKADKHFSVNRFKKFLKCPLCYGMIYRGNLTSLPNVYTMRGNIIHSVMEWIHKNKRFDFTEAFNYAIQNQYAEIKKTTDRVGPDVIPQLIDMLLKAKDMAIPIAMQIPREFIETAISSDLSEEEIIFERVLSNGESYAVLAYIDLVKDMGDRIIAIDWKTDSNPKKGEHSFQGSVYSAILEELYGKPVEWNLGYFQKRRFSQDRVLNKNDLWKLTDAMVAEIRKEQWTPNLNACLKPFPCDVLTLCPIRNQNG